MHNRERKHVVLLRYLGVGSVILAVLAIPPSLVSGLGVLVALCALLMGALSALGGRMRFALVTTLIVTVNIFGFSVLTTLWTAPPLPPGAQPPPIGSAIHPPSSKAESESEGRSREWRNVIWLIGAPYGAATACVLFGLWRRSSMSGWGNR